MNTLKYSGRLMLIVAALVAVVACTIPGPSHQTAKQFFVLQDRGGSVPSPGQAAEPKLSLRISAPDSAPGLNTSRMAYSTEPNRLDWFAYHEWIAPPAKMIASMMESRLQASGLFNAVLVDSPDVRTDLRLDSEVQVLQQDFTSNGDTLNLAIRVNLVEVATRSLLGTKTFSYSEPVVEENAVAGAAAANRATHHFLDDLTVFLEASIEQKAAVRKQDRSK